jgi:hypothetical protein
VTPRLPLGPHPCNPFCLGREPKARVATLVFIIATTSGAQITRSFPIQQLLLIVLLKMPTAKELKNYKGRKTLPDLKLTQEKYL